MTLAKQVISGTSVITLARVGSKLLYFVVVLVLTPLLGPEPYGVTALAATVISLGSTLALLGIDLSYTRFFLQEDITTRLSVERLCWRFSVAGSVSYAVLIGGGWYWLGHRWLPSYYQIVAIYSLFAIVLSVAETMATTRIRLAGHYHKVAVATISAAVASALITLGVAIFWRSDIWALFSGTLGASFITLVLLGIPDRTVFLKRSDLSSEKKRAIVSMGLAASIIYLLHWVVSSSDRWFLAEYSDTAVIGVYFMASNVALLGSIVNSSLTLTWFPEVSRIYSTRSSSTLVSLGRLWGRLVTGLSVVWVAVSAAGGDVLRLLAAPEFHPGAAYIPWLAGGMFFYGLGGLASTAFFLKNKMRYVAYFWLIGGALSLSINLLLVPHLGAHGAAIAQCASYGVVAVGILAASRRVLPMPVDWLRLTLSLVVALSAGIIMSFSWLENPLLSLLGKFPVGVLISTLLLLIIAPDWFERAFKKVRVGL
ncbi:MAG: lipopolysaccharide biosynthesis protein [Candidatus Thiosymbion ectosymbiont of Robbea hypermnestra]|nr:lipopolysaccharide biosynthesis protein [Candidatus Thiosymbion ectosymbiont of Robbea hypermnestra]